MPTSFPRPGGEYETGIPRAHHRFDIPDGDVIIQVNNALFRVHRHFLVEHSTVLSDLLSLPRPDLNSTERKRVLDDPIKVSGDSVYAWECMLGLFYPKNPCRHPAYTAKQWAAVLLLAHKYLMDGIELSALQKLQVAGPPLDMVDLMVLSQQVDSEELYHTALHSLAQRDQMLSFEEAHKIGIKAFHDVVMMEHVYYTRTRRSMR